MTGLLNPKSSEFQSWDTMVFVVYLRHGIVHRVALLFERSEFLIATCKKKKLTVCVCGCSANLGFSEEKVVLVLV